MQETIRNLFLTGLVLAMLYTCGTFITSFKQPKHILPAIKGYSYSQRETVLEKLKNKSKKDTFTAKPTSKPTSNPVSKQYAASTTRPRIRSTSVTSRFKTTSSPYRASTTPPRIKSVPEESGLCPKTPPGLKGPINPNLEIIDWDTQHKKHPELTAGGFWRPTSCRARHKVAILVPYRKRDEHLHVFTNTMHDFLQKQQVDYGIYIIEQAGSALFNRALLFNIGYKEAMKDQPWDCLVFHDVDNIPMNDMNLYHCSERPRHLSVAVERFNYILPYTGYFGGVSMMSTNNYEKINGMSNKYWGWGGEDDDLYYRCNGKRLTPVLRYPAAIGRYRTITKHHVQGAKNPERFRLLKQWAGHWATDGLSDLKYKVITKEYRKLFTYLLADVSLMEKKKTWG